eukprot:2056205-Rhodomonas_salina.1
MGFGGARTIHQYTFMIAETEVEEHQSRPGVGVPRPHTNEVRNIFLAAQAKMKHLPGCSSQDEPPLRTSPHLLATPSTHPTGSACLRTR